MKQIKRYFIALMITAIVGSTSVQAQQPAGQTVRVEINGLVCDFCAQALEKMFLKKQAVSNIQVDLTTKLLTIHFNTGQMLNDYTITKLIVDSGYSVEKIHREE